MQTCDEPTLTAKLIDSANLNDNLDWVSADASFKSVQTRLTLNQFSQLPVFSGSGRKASDFCGSVSWKSIAEAQLSGANTQCASELKISTAVERAHTVDIADDLLHVTSQVLDYEYVYVRDGARIVGVVTLFDLVKFLQHNAAPFLLVAEIESRLRAAISSVFSTEELKSVTGDSRITSVDDLTMFGYITIINDDDCWFEMNWPVDRTPVVQAIEQVRRARNKLMHFGDRAAQPAPETFETTACTADLNDLRRVAEFLRRFAPVATVEE